MTPNPTSTTSTGGSREVDFGVAQGLFGWQRPKPRCVTWTAPEGYGCGEQGIPHFSTDIAAAFTVVEAMRARGYGFSIEWPKDHDQQQGDEGHCGFSRWTENHEGLGCEWSDFGSGGDLPRAICECALAALATLAESDQ